MPGSEPVAVSDADATACDIDGDDDSGAIAKNPDTCDVSIPENAELRRVVDAWPELSEPIRSAILALVQTGMKGGL